MIGGEALRGIRVEHAWRAGKKTLLRMTVGVLHPRKTSNLPLLGPAVQHSETNKQTDKNQEDLDAKDQGDDSQ
jgi:hypothetical protein